MTNLSQEIERFCKLHNLAESKFGLLALNDKAFVSQLRAGRDIRYSTAERVRVFMAEYKPQENAA